MASAIGVGRVACAAALTVVLSAGAWAGTFTLEDVKFWVGEGSKRAGFVVDLGDGGDGVAWGYRWDGEATGYDMFLAVAAADPALHARIGEAGGFGVPVFGMGLDVDGDGFALSDGTRFVEGVAVTAPSDDAVALDGDDRYSEGWAVNGYWAYWVGDGEPYGGGSWGFAPVGMAERVLSDGDWDGWAFAPGFEGDAPGVPVAAAPAVGVCTADLSRDGVVDSADLNLLLADFGCVGCGDIDGDGAVDSSDLNILLGAFGTSCD